MKQAFRRSLKMLNRENGITVQKRDVYDYCVTKMSVDNCKSIVEFNLYILLRYFYILLLRLMYNETIMHELSLKLEAISRLKRCVYANACFIVVSSLFPPCFIVVSKQIFVKKETTMKQALFPHMCFYLQIELEMNVQKGRVESTVTVRSEILYMMHQSY